MSLFVSLICVGVVVLAIPLTALRPHYVFYLYLVCIFLGNILAGYINAAGNLGMPRTWQPADVLALLTLAAMFLYHRDPRSPTDLIIKCLRVIAVLAAVGLAMGVIMYPKTGLAMSRHLFFIPAALFAGRYLVDANRLSAFLRFSAVVLLGMFVLHVLIRFGVYTPPVAQEMVTGQMAGERGDLSLALPAYLALLAMGLARMAGGGGSRIAAIVWLTAASTGILLSEARALYGAAAVTGLVSLFILKGRIQLVIALGLGGVAVLLFVQAIGFDPTNRLRGRFGRGEIRSPLESLESDTWRMQEYPALIQSFRNEPIFIMTGRPLGSLHSVGWQVHAVPYYHSEYLAYLDRLGVVGFCAFMTLWVRVLAVSFSLIRGHVPSLRDYGATVFLMSVGLMAHALFAGSLMHQRAGPLLFCFVAALANWRTIQQTPLTGDWRSEWSAEQAA